MVSESGSEAGMTGIEERLRGELSDVLDLIRRAGGGVVFEEFPGALEIDPMDDSSSAVRLALIDEANELAETLDRIRRGADGRAATTGAAGAAGATGQQGEKSR
jgi:hypothetical protein